jgi:hypothetical protein
MEPATSGGRQTPPAPSPPSSSSSSSTTFNPIPATPTTASAPAASAPTPTSAAPSDYSMMLVHTTIEPAPAPSICRHRVVVAREAQRGIGKPDSPRLCSTHRGDQVEQIKAGEPNHHRHAALAARSALLATHPPLAAPFAALSILPPTPLLPLCPPPAAPTVDRRAATKSDLFAPLFVQRKRAGEDEVQRCGDVRRENVAGVELYHRRPLFAPITTPIASTTFTAAFRKTVRLDGNGYGY